MEGEYPTNVESSYWDQISERRWKEKEKTKLYVTISDVKGDYANLFNGKHEVNTGDTGGLKIINIKKISCKF